jgi:N-acetylmuramoyl-L-alanine amidase
LARAGLAALVLAAGSALGRAAILESLDAEPGTVRIALSEPAPHRLSVIRTPDGSPVRLYVDLPAGTTLAPGVPRSVAGSEPVTGVRVGIGDDGGVRVLVELDGADAFRLMPERRGRELVLTVDPVAGAEPPVGPTPPPAVANEATRPRAGRVKIVLDPGHGGDDPGAMGFAVEKDVTLAITRQVARLLEDRLGAVVVLTRTSDRTLPLAARTARANSEGADLFVSVHANANPHGRLRGVETYYLDPHGDHATLRLASMENGLDLLHPKGEKAGLRYILSDLVQVGKMEESAALASAVQRGVVRRLQSRYRGVVDLGVKRGPFYVLVGAYMPCVLVETAFLTHPVEGRRLAGPAYRADLAEGLYAGIAGFVAQTRQARTL